MKKILLLMTLFSLFSCELHEQSAYLKVKSDNSTFNLEKVDTLFAAVINNDYELLDQELIKDRSFVNVKNEQGQLLFLEALKTKKFLLVILFLENGADTSIKDDEGIGVFDVINSYKDKDSWINLLETGVVDNVFLNKQLVNLVKEGAVDSQDKIIRQMKIYIERGADLNIVDSRFPLIAHAALKNMFDVVKHLCERGDVDINAKVGRKTLLGFIKDKMRRSPELASIHDLLASFGAI